MVDLGYQGIRFYYENDRIRISYKKPRKSKNDPTPQLTKEQKIYNKELSKIRVFIEHSIGGMKRFQILVNRLRSRTEFFIENVNLIACGLWNLHLSISKNC